MNPSEHVAHLPAPTYSARLLFGVLSKLRKGRLAVTSPEGVRRVFTGPEAGPSADLEIRDWKAVGRMVRAAEIGVAECWRDGLIATSDMTALLRLCEANQQALEAVWYGNPVVAFLYRVAHWLRPNTKAGSRRNIHAHYDLGNDFYALWLDRTMTYSSALFTQGTDGSLERAQEAKYERMLDELGVESGHHVLEVGCGWGGFAEYAVRTRGCRWTGITISQAQLDFARERIRRAGLEGRVELRFQDYRDLSGQYDRIVSVEMIEAVGERWWPAYFARLRDCLVPGGRAMIQAITIDEAAFAKYRGTSDFIREYIFPGGMLASPERLARHGRDAGLAVREPFRFGPHYAETLRRWREAVDAREREIKALGFNERFLAIWRFYLHYCEVGFDARRIDVIHLGLERTA
ncbi:MAG: cyclopropane-fatty-acyl-phospholipid synthase family protein [Burkholderiales bacterium]|nr:cyclopropane-fatty-acyl-phospholipid synthase family protein [Burkholderiales bacterium]